MSTPDAPLLVVHPDDLARRLGIDLPLAGDVEWALREAIGDVQADVQAYLGQPVTPVRYTESGVYSPDRAGLRVQPVQSIESIRPDVDSSGYDLGTWTVVYTAGIDARTDDRYRPIRRYIAARATLNPNVTRHVPAGKREITSVSVEGQSVSFKPVGGVSLESLPPDQQVPQLESLRRFRRVNVFQRRG